MNRNLVSDTISLAGAVALLAGVALVYVPAALILAGAGALAFGLFGIEVGEER